MRTADTLSIHHLYSEHHPWLLSWLKRQLGHHADAADLAQDTFIRLMTSQTSLHFESPAYSRALLKTVAKNLCINHWRRQEIERAWLETLADAPEAIYPSAERQAIVLQALEEISLMLSKLKPKAAQAFTLAVIFDLSDDRVGAEMGISGRMVRKYVAQAMLACLKLRARDTTQALLSEQPD